MRCSSVALRGGAFPPSFKPHSFSVFFLAFIFVRSVFSDSGGAFLPLIVRATFCFAAGTRFDRKQERTIELISRFRSSPNPEKQSPKYNYILETSDH